MSRPSAAPVRVLSPLLVEWLSCAVFLLTLSLRLLCAVSGRDAVGVDRLVCCFAL